MASWLGDADTLGDDSPIITLQVVETLPVDYLPDTTLPPKIDPAIHNYVPFLWLRWFGLCIDPEPHPR